MEIEELMELFMELVFVVHNFRQWLTPRLGVAGIVNFYHSSYILSVGEIVTVNILNLV